MKNSRTGERQSSPRLRALFGLLYTVFLVGGCYFGYLFYATVKDIVAHTQIPYLPNLPVIERIDRRAVDLPDWEKGERVNVLLLGIDKRQGEEGPWRTDTMILVTADPKSKTAGMLSIPRDLYVEIPGYGEGRINTAHFLGGPELAKKTVQYNLGVPVHYYARIDFWGFEKLIDTLGGITVEVEEEIRDNRYPDNNYGYMSIYIPAGVQHMDGDMALKYARTRHGGSDFARIKRQQKVLLAIRDQALRLNLLPKLPALMKTTSDAVQTDLQPGEILALASIGARIKQENIRGAAIDEFMTFPVTTPEGAQVLWPNRELIGKLIEELFGSPQPIVERQSEEAIKLAQEGAKIAVQNGTTTSGLARQVAIFLQQRGYQIINVSDAERSDYSKTVIVDYTGKNYTIALLAELFHVEAENVRRSPNPNSSQVDIRLILGSDFELPTE